MAFVSEGTLTPEQMALSPYSGLGPAWQTFGQTNVMPILQQLLAQYPQMSSAAYGDAAKTAGTAYDSANAGLGNFASQTLAPALQGTVNDLNANGVLNSSVAGDALAKTASTIGTGVLGMQNQNQTAKAGVLGNLAQLGAASQMQYPNFALNTAQTGQYSNDPTTMYRMWASLASGQ
jgi:hypothetical protein